MRAPAGGLYSSEWIPLDPPAYHREIQAYPDTASIHSRQHLRVPLQLRLILSPLRRQKRLNIAAFRIAGLEVDNQANSIFSDKGPINCQVPHLAVDHSRYCEFTLSVGLWTQRPAANRIGKGPGQSGLGAVALAFT